MAIYVVEAKLDQQKLIDYVGEDTAKLFFSMKSRLKSPENDIYYWLKRPPEELKDRLSREETYEEEKQKSSIISQRIFSVIDNNELEEMLREISEKYKNSKSVEVYEEQLEWWFKLIDDLREENEKLKEDCKVVWILNDEIRRVNENLREENKKLKEELEQAIYWKVDYEKSYKQAEAKKDELLEENKELKETIKDHQLYEEKLEHRIIEFEELLHWE